MQVEGIRRANATCKCYVFAAATLSSGNTVRSLAQSRDNYINRILNILAMITSGNEPSIELNLLNICYIYIYTCIYIFQAVCRAVNVFTSF